MQEFDWSEYVENYDERRDAVIPGTKNDTIRFAVEHFISLCRQAIEDHGYFAVALSGGSTPQAIYQALSEPENAQRIHWSKVVLFWSDERAVPPDHPDSNYKMAMDAGLRTLPILPENIHRMKAEQDIEQHALEYEKTIESLLSGGVFDLVMLGVGEDGHTASLFPETHGLHAGDRLVVANYIPQLHTWRMTLTFSCINRARRIAIYVIGKSKASILKTVLSENEQPDLYPIQRIGTPATRALWIADSAALSEIYLS